MRAGNEARYNSNTWESEPKGDLVKKYVQENIGNECESKLQMIPHC